MFFCTGLVSFFQMVGFNTDNWRKSIDGTQVIVHEEYAKILIPNYQTNSNITLYQYPSVELDNLLNSPQWTPEKVV